MKIDLIYFSGSGNTKHLCKELAILLEQEAGVTLRCIPVEEAGEQADADMLGFAFPVYHLQPPRIMTEYVKNVLATGKKRPGFILSTYGTIPLDSNSFLITELQEKNIDTICSKSIKSPAASMHMFSKLRNPLFKKLGSFDKNAYRQLAEFAKDIVSGFACYSNQAFSIKPAFFPLNKLVQGMSELFVGRRFYRKLAVSEHCDGCGICAKKCPDNNIVIQDSKAVIQRGDACLQCLRCSVMCGKAAIGFTNVKRKGNYPVKKAAELFEIVKG